MEPFINGEETIVDNMIIVGASGVLGKMICYEIQRLFIGDFQLIVTDYNHRRGNETATALGKKTLFRPLDVNHKEAITSAIWDASCVIVATKQELPLIQQYCAKKGILCIDVTVFRSFVEQVREIDCQHSASIVMAGFFPGLSGLLVRRAITGFSEVHEVNVGLLQNTNAQAGLSGIKDMLSIVSRRSSRTIATAGAATAQDSAPGVRARARTMKFPHPFGQKKVRAISHAEASYLSSHFLVTNLHYWTAWQSSSFNWVVQLLDKLNVIPLIQTGKADRLLASLIRHNPNQGEHCALSVEVTGLKDGLAKSRTLTLSVPSDYRTTAMFTAALAKFTMDKSKSEATQTLSTTAQKKLTGVLFPFEYAELENILRIMDCPDILLQES